MIIKRDGRAVQFDSKKIHHAILKAFCAIDGKITPYALEKADNISNYIESIYSNMNKDISVEEIQDLVEHGLMSCKRKDVARAYITYRNERTAKREKDTLLKKTIKEKLAASNIQNQNANVDEYSFGGRMGEAASAMTKQIAIEELLSNTARYNHINNRVYIHDLDHYVLGDHNCLSIPFDDLLAKGFNTRQTDVRPANSVNTAFQLIAVIFQLQSLQQFGGVAATHLDWTMVPYVRKSFYKHYKEGFKYLLPDETFPDIEHGWDMDVFFDELSITDMNYKIHKNVYSYAMDMTVKECQQAVEGMFHNLNTLQSRSGN